MVSSRLRVVCAVFAAVLCLAACGCFEYNEEIRLNEDGSGTVRVHGWIDYETASGFYSGAEDEQVLPPVTAGTVKYLITGSSKVWADEVTVVPEGGKWTFDIRVSFADIDELKKTNYFRQRNPSLAFRHAKELRFSCRATPTPVEMAKDYAEVYKDNPYSEKYIEAYGGERFSRLTNQADFDYVVSMRAADAAGNAQSVEAVEKNRIEGRWHFEARELLDAEKTVSLDLIATLPPERGFTEIVILLLLASVAGIIIPAVRLVIPKMQGVS